MNTDLTFTESLKLRKLLAVAVRITLEAGGTDEAERFAELTDMIWGAYELQTRESYARLQARGLKAMS